jgi:phosphoenolpyruvate carboxylase
MKRIKEGVLGLGERKVPATTATQLPDNIERPFWSLKESASASDDFFDCYVAFKEFGCHEYFWDWQDRKLDELLVKKLIHAYRPFFAENPIGKKCFITFRTDGGSLETLGRIYMSIISSNDFSSGQNMFSPPLFEVSHTASSSDELLHFATLYNETVSMATERLGHECSPKHLSVIPTHNFDGKWYTALNKYLVSSQNSFRNRMELIRPLIPRAGIAERMGFIASTLATKRALASYSSFEKIAGVEVSPIVDAGPLLFRGGLSPYLVKEFIENYPGARTATITPAFRYSYELEDAKEAINYLNRHLTKNSAEEYSREDLARLAAIENVFTKSYQAAVEALPFPDYSAELMRMKKTVDPRLARTFSLYSLGIPPELAGTGKALAECIRQKMVKDLERFYPLIKQDLSAAGRLLNRENLKFLAKTNPAWAAFVKDVQLVEDYTDSTLGPGSTDDFLHRNHTSNVFHCQSSNRGFTADLIAAAKLRRCVG